MREKEKNFGSKWNGASGQVIKFGSKSKGKFGFTQIRSATKEMLTVVQSIPIPRIMVIAVVPQ